MIATTSASRRKRTHLRNYDYASPGYYFVTLCTHGKQSLFGEIVDGQIRLNEVGRLVMNCWSDIPLHYPTVDLDISVVMPNHVHGVIVLGAVQRARHASPLLESGTVSLGTVVGSFKFGRE